MRTTQQIRDDWEPHCDSKGRHGVSLLPAWHALDAVMRKHSYALKRGETGAFNCRPITGGTRYSLHAYAPGETWTTWNGVPISAALATDFNWNQNPYGPRLVTDMPRAMVDEICAIRTIDDLPVFRWGGYYSGNKDAMHFEIVASPAELARGIASTTQEEPWMALTPTGQARFEKLFNDDDRWGRLNALLDKADEFGTITDQWDSVVKAVTSSKPGAGVTKTEMAAAFTKAAEQLKA